MLSIITRIHDILTLKSVVGMSLNNETDVAHDAKAVESTTPSNRNASTQTKLAAESKHVTDVSHENDAQELRFILFPKLPLELRCEIWGFATPPKTIVLPTLPYDSDPEHNMGPYRRSDDVPSVLHA